ncbi:hypothetical protein BDZ91DRAFT_733306 [Kalaharituber pfeilii]|nr:hypothetical protein BDZ91DRAFT_733306 [Kalaharituber pfeilii]
MREGGPPALWPVCRSVCRTWSLGSGTRPGSARCRRGRSPRGTSPIGWGSRSGGQGHCHARGSLDPQPDAG